MYKTRCCQQRPPKGFTLLDCLMVILILGVLAAVAVPGMQSMQSQSKLNEAAQELVAALLYARDLAARYQRPFGVLADAGGEWFRVFDDRYKLDPSPHPGEDPPVGAGGVVVHPVEKGWYEIDFDTTAPYGGVDLVSVPPGGEVCFHPDGHSSAAGGSFVVAYGGEQRTVIVAGTTGAITVQ